MSITLLGCGGPVASAPAITTAWDATQAQVVAGNLTLTTSNRTVTKNTASGRINNHIEATKAISNTEKKFWEIQLNGHAAATNDTGLGVAITGNASTNALGDTSASAGWFLNTALFQAGNPISGTGGFQAFTTGDVFLVAFDGTTQFMDIYFPSQGAWSRDGSAATFSAIGSGLHFDLSSGFSGGTSFSPGVTCDNNPDSYTINTGAVSFVNTAQVAQLVAAGYTQLG